MANTFTKIASVSVGSGGSSTITFSSIPADYTDLCVKISVRSNRSGAEDYISVRFNGSTTSQRVIRLEGNGSSAYGSAENNNWSFIADAVPQTSNTFTSVDFYIPNYAGSTNKSFSSDAVMENNATFAMSSLVSGLWSNTSAITQVEISSAVASFVQYSTATLYGISKS
jgi:hypothetical protein